MCSHNAAISFEKLLTESRYDPSHRTLTHTQTIRVLNIERETEMPHEHERSKGHLFSIAFQTVTFDNPK